MRIPAHIRIYSVFFLFALSLGGLLSRVPDLQRQLGLTESQLGLTLIGMAIGSLISLTTASPLIHRLGARATAFITVFGTAAIYALVPWLPSAPAVFAALFVAGGLAGALEINVNIETDKLEAQLGRRIMNRAHGMWSLGFFVTALAGAGIRQLGISIQVHTALLLVLVVAVGLVTFSGMVTTPERADAHQGETPRFALPTIGLLPLCMIGIAAFLVEGAGVDWSAIYMRDVFQAEPFVGGSGLTLFTFFMAITRIYIDPFVERYGPRAIATLLLVICLVGAARCGSCADALGGACRLCAPGDRLQCCLSAGGFGRGAADRPAGVGQCRGHRAGDLHRVLPRPAAAGLCRPVFRHPDVLPGLPAGDPARPLGGAGAEPDGTAGHGAAQRAGHAPWLSCRRSSICGNRRPR